MVQIFRTHHVCGPRFSNATVTSVSDVHVTLAPTVEGTPSRPGMEPSSLLDVILVLTVEVTPSTT